ncbi:MAG: ParB/RepB/Spo0J family partition protein [Roseburia sp.]
MAANKRPKIHFESVEELLGAPVMKDGTEVVKIKDIHPFKDHPFKVLDDDKMDELVESIKANGVFSPVLIRPREEGGYEMISGHRRLHASERAGLTSIPAIIKEMTDDEAVIAMVDSNVQREEILPSERAYSFKMKMDALRHQGFRSDLVKDENTASDTQCRRLETAAIVGKEVGMGQVQVRKYVRLTELVPELLDLVDAKRITMTMAVDISYFDKEIQQWIFEYRRDNGILLPDQINALKELRNIDNITKYTFTATMNNALPEKKVNGRVNLSEKKLNRYFPARMTSMERERIILELLEDWKERKDSM